VINANYPIPLGNVSYVVNVSAALQVLLRIIRPILNKQAMASFKFMSSDPHEWKETFNQFLNTDQIPVRYGGTRELLIDEI